MMEGMAILIGIALIVYVLIAPVFGIVALRRADRIREEAVALKGQVALLGQRIDDLRRAMNGLRREGGPAGEAAEAAPAPAQESPRPAPAAPAAAAATPPRQTQAPTAPSPAGPQVTGTDWGRVEEWLTSRGLVWLGGLALALAVVFLVKFSIERGWLGPVVRVSVGFAFGVALVAAGEWLRRQPLQRAIAALKPNYVPAALTAAGIFACFASVYTAYGLYGLLVPLAAFALLAGIAFAAVALAVLQGPLIAVLGLLGGYATPLLVSTGEPLIWELFTYLLALTAAGLVVVRYMAWWWLAWATLAGAALWALLWFRLLWSAGDALPLGLYLLVLCGLFLLVRHGRGASVELVAWPKAFAALALPERIAWASAGAVAFLTFILVRMDAYGPVSLAVLAAFALLLLAIGYWEAVFDGLALVAAALVTALVATWHLPRIISRNEPLIYLEGQPYGAMPGFVVPPELTTFAAVTVAFGAIFAVFGFVALWGARRPALWAGVSAAAPVLLLTAAYWRLESFGIDLKWSAVAVGLAALNVAAVSRVQRHREARDLKLSLGFFAAATVAALSLAATMALEQAWLTVALALQLPALAWIHDRLALPPLRKVALVLAAVVLVRLVFNVHVLDYPLGSVPGFNWVLYGYGIPALAFWWAARRFRAAADDRLVMVLEAGTLAFVTLLISFEIRSLVAGSLDSGHYGLLEQGLQSAAWLGLAYGWLIQYRRHRRVTLLWGWRILAGLAAIQTLLYRMLLDNPLWSGDPVGSWPILDLLLLAFLVPAVFAFLFAREFLRAGERRLGGAAALSGFALVFVYITLEVRHLFHGPVLTIGPETDAELYSYSAAWLVYALAMFGLGIWKQAGSLRYVAFAILAVTIAKVFLVDMSELSDLFRVVTFLGLALAMIAVALVYQRYVFPPKGSTAPPESEPSAAEAPG